MPKVRDFESREVSRLLGKGKKVEKVQVRESKFGCKKPKRGRWVAHQGVRQRGQVTLKNWRGGFHTNVVRGKSCGRGRRTQPKMFTRLKDWGKGKRGSVTKEFVRGNGRNLVIVHYFGGKIKYV